jgi:hypothetical protein
MERFGLRDDQWDGIKDILPGREGHVGGMAADNRLFVEAVQDRYAMARSAGALRLLEERASAVQPMTRPTMGLAEREITPVIPPKANRKTKRDCDSTASAI